AREGSELASRERWLVLNKLDLLPADERNARCEAIEAALSGKSGGAARVYRISAAQREGTEALMYDILNYLDEQALLAAEADGQV
ncbi:GTP-binding protein Obg, partial [hydrothermal vent metagenome]